MSVWTDPSPSDWDRWEQRLLDGEEPSVAARAEGQTCSAFRRVNPSRHGELLALSREIRAGEDRSLVRDRLRDVVSDTTHPQWAKGAELLGRHVQMFDDTQRVEITGADGGPVAIAHEERLTLADVAHFAAQLRSGAGDRGQLPGARGLLSASDDGVASAGDVPARRDT